jgi:hypothetical protein
LLWPFQPRRSPPFRSPKNSSPRRLRRATSISRIRSRGPLSRQSLSDGGGRLANSFGGSTDRITPRPSFDQKREELTLLNGANHTYRTVEWPVAKRMSPQKGTTLKRGGEYKIAGQNCIDWSWMDGTEMHTACLTPDGVLLRLVIDGQIVAEARSVLYAPQPPELFEVPPGYEPALAPEGGPTE